MSRTKGGMGAVAPMKTGRQLTGWSRRGQRPWPVKAGPARPGQQTGGLRARAQAPSQPNRGGRSWNA
jgi:hypothetical protein